MALAMGDANPRSNSCPPPLKRWATQPSHLFKHFCKQLRGTRRGQLNAKRCRMGSKRGWLIAAGMVIVLALVVGRIRFWPAALTEPTAATTAPGRLARIASPESIWALVDKPTGPGLAADDYNKGVVEFYDSDRYAKLRALPAERKLAIGYDKFPYEVCKWITAGATERRMDYFAQYVKPADAVRPSHRDLIDPASAEDPPLPHLPAFMAMAEAALLYGDICEKHNKSAEAESLYKAVLVFGHHVAEDRVRLWGLQTGLRIQQLAAQHLGRFYQQRDKPALAKKGSTLLEDLNRTVEAVRTKAGEAVFRLSKRGHLHPGDLRNVAVLDADPMWRVEATWRLGLCRAALSQRKRSADYQAITDLLTRSKDSEDLFIRAAADLALGMTVEDVRTAH